MKTNSSIRMELDALRVEHAICKKKLDSKYEALQILSKDLDRCRQERDQFKLMAEQVQQRYQGLKRQLAGVAPQKSFEPSEFSGMKTQSLAQLLCEMREVNKALQFDVDDLKLKLADAQGDTKLLREQIVRQRVGTTDEGLNTRYFPAHEREELVKKLEESHEKNALQQRDLQQILDEKEELATEKDAYKMKHERLNQELNLILKGDEHRIVDIDALSMENKYLQDRLKQMEEEKSVAMATVSKYKSLLERKKGGNNLRPLGDKTPIIIQKQVRQLLEQSGGSTTGPQALSDLQALAGALLDTINDKNLALSHQRKSNKILGTRVSELEKKLRTLEISEAWCLKDGESRPNGSDIERLRTECEALKSELQEDPKDEETSSTMNGDNDMSELLKNAGLSIASDEAEPKVDAEILQSGIFDDNKPYKNDETSQENEAQIIDHAFSNGKSDSNLQ